VAIAVHALRRDAFALPRLQKKRVSVLARTHVCVKNKTVVIVAVVVVVVGLALDIYIYTSTCIGLNRVHPSNEKGVCVVNP